MNGRTEAVIHLIPSSLKKKWIFKISAAATAKDDDIIDLTCQILFHIQHLFVF